MNLTDSEGDLLGSLDDVVDARETSELSDGVESGIGDKLEREDGDEVNEEPGLEVATGYLSPVADESLDLVVVGGEEGDDDVGEEDYINKDFYEFPLNLSWIYEAHLDWSEYRRDQDHTTLDLRLT